MRRRTTTLMLTTAATTALLGTSGCTGFLANATETAPSTEPQSSHETAEELLTAVEDSAEQIEDLASEITFTTGSGTTQSGVTLIGEGAADFSDGHYTVTESGADSGAESGAESGTESRTTSDIEIYFDDTGLYSNENGRGWYETYGDAGGGEDTSYSNVVTALGELGALDRDDELDSEIEISHEDDTATITYSGHDSGVFDALKTPFNLSLDGTSPEQTTMTLEAEVDTETMYLTDLSFSWELHSPSVMGTPGDEESPFADSSAEPSTEPSVEPSTDATPLLGVELAYSEFNEIGPIEIPQEVRDEANGETTGP